MRWELDYGKVDGKRKQKFFKTKTDAETEFAKVKELRRLHGDRSLSLSEDDRIRFSAARDQLRAVDATIDQAVKFYLDHARPLKPIRLGKMLDAFLWAKACQGKRTRYQQQLKCSCSNFIREREEFPAHLVARPLIEQWLHGNKWAPKTQSVYLGDVRTMFSWALKQNHVTKNPCLDIELASPEPEEVTTMGVIEAERLLCAALTAWDVESRRPLSDLLGYVALGLFCGIRPEELQRSDLASMDLDHATMIVAGRHAKTRQRRVVDISANAVEWLRAWRRLCPDQERIAGKNFKRRWERLREGCGWKLPWPHDVMRHTFASMHYAAYQNESKLQALMGHESANVLFSNYRAIRTPVEARKFWELRPIVPELNSFGRSK